MLIIHWLNILLLSTLIIIHYFLLSKNRAHDSDPFVDTILISVLQIMHLMTFEVIYGLSCFISPQYVLFVIYNLLLISDIM